MKVTKLMRAMASPPPAGDNGPQLNSRDFTWEPVMWTGIRAMMATMQIADENEEASQGDDGLMLTLAD
jgi:hypothetical protein